VQAHAYWRLKGLTVDLVIWNEDRAGYRQQLQDQILGLIAAGVEAHVIDRPGGIFIRPADQISDEDRILFQTVARAILSDSRGTLAEQLNRRGPPAGHAAPAARPGAAALPNGAGALRAAATSPVPRDGARLLHFDNGMGGFTAGWARIRHHHRAGEATPAPWVNVLANAHFGTVISASGMAYTWSENAHEFRLTPWHNDPVSDAAARPSICATRTAAMSGRPRRCRWRRGAPSGGEAPDRASRDALRPRHGFGYSVFEHTEAGIHSELWVYVGRGRTDQVLGAQAAQSVESFAPTLRDRLCRVGARRSAPQDQPACHHRDRSDQRHAVRAQSLQHRVRRPHRLLRRRRYRRAP
jgi:cyclic beta-1,2-glucan synthetase